MFTVSSPRFPRPRLLTAFWLVCLTLWLPALALAQTSVAPTSGDGTSVSTAYQITSLQNLAWLQARAAAGATSGTYCALANNIDATSTTYATYNGGAGFSPIGTYDLPFQGAFEGNGYTITNLTVNGTNSRVGLFGALENNRVQNLKLQNVNIQGNAYVGGLAGTTKLDVTIKNCSVSGTITGVGSGTPGDYSGTRIGGLLGNTPLGNTSILQCTTNVTVTGLGYVGGLIGIATAPTGYPNTVSQCSSSGEVSDSAYYAYTGGLIGYARCAADTTQTLSQCYSSCDVVGTAGAGGLIGGLYVEDRGIQTVSQCFTNGTVRGSTVGGLIQVVGNTNGTQSISQCFTSGYLKGSSQWVGGLIGNIASNTGVQTISQCFSNGYLKDSTYDVGGLVAVVSNGATGSQYFSQCFASGMIKGTHDVGGLFGTIVNNGEQFISQCYANGSVSGVVTLPIVLSAGGITGNPSGTGITVYDSCYWNTTQSGLTLGTVGSTLAGMTGKTSVEMYDTSAYPTWDFLTDWGIDSEKHVFNGGYPYLRAFDVVVWNFRINQGAASTTSRLVTLDSLVGDYATHYMASEDPNFSDASKGNTTWQAYDSAPTFVLSSGPGVKTVYFKVMSNNDTTAANDDIESDVAAAVISLENPACAFVKGSIAAQSTHAETYVKKTASITSKDAFAFKATVNLPSDFDLTAVAANTQINITVGDWTFSDTLTNAAAKSLKGVKGGTAVFRTQVLVGKKKVTTQIVTLTWTSKRVLKVVVTGTPLTTTGSAITTNILNALSADDGTVAAKVPIAVTLGDADARDDLGVTCTGRRSTSTVKNTSVNLNKWIMTGKK